MWVLFTYIYIYLTISMPLRSPLFHQLLVLNPCKLCRNTEGMDGGSGFLVIFANHELCHTPLNGLKVWMVGVGSFYRTTRTVPSLLRYSLEAILDFER
jgi:hypothetical protein